MYSRVICFDGMLSRTTIIKYSLWVGRDVVDSYVYKFIGYSMAYYNSYVGHGYSEKIFYLNVVIHWDKTGEVHFTNPVRIL